MPRGREHELFRISRENVFFGMSFEKRFSE